MHIHILGICGTFMGSLAVLARDNGHKVTGCDSGVYPPMSTQLEANGIALTPGFDPEQLQCDADLYVIGNAISRGNPLLEAILDKGLPYTSGPALLADIILPGRWVLAVSGTHGKTTTSSMLAWILEYAGMSPGFLIGGVPGNFGTSGRLGETPFFVIEADEYDSAFFDKRSKFVHYRPRTLIVNNLEFDHADIFPDLAAIQTQFHHLIRTMPASARIIYPASVENIDAVMAKGCWSEQQSFAEASTASAGQACWSKMEADGSRFTLQLDGQRAEVNWELTGDHNVANGVAALLAARHVGVTLETGGAALSAFKGVKRRMECLMSSGGVSLYDDFAHHPTAIQTTLQGLREKVGSERIVALIEPRSNTMRMGVHQNSLIASAEAADHVIWAELEDMSWLAEALAGANQSVHERVTTLEAIVPAVLQQIQGETHVVVMSNGGFGGIHQKLLAALEKTGE